MDRRNFFRSALGKGGKAVIKTVDAHINKEASRWLRPPFAINELEFLLACSRCRDCIDACPYQVIFSLPARLGAKFAGTPALDLLNKGCHLCEDWPCVRACEADALVLPESNHDCTAEADNVETDKNSSLPFPRLADVTVDEETCLPYSGPECGVCFSSCPVPGALIQEYSRPIINQQLCCGCALCRETCIVDPKAITISAGPKL